MEHGKRRVAGRLGGAGALSVSMGIALLFATAGPSGACPPVVQEVEVLTLVLEQAEVNGVPQEPGALPEDLTVRLRPSGALPSGYFVEIQSPDGTPYLATLR